jgi:hypothetical protein
MQERGRIAARGEAQHLPSKSSGKLSSSAASRSDSATASCAVRPRSPMARRLGAKREQTVAIGDGDINLFV